MRASTRTGAPFPTRLTPISNANQLFLPRRLVHLVFGTQREVYVGATIDNLESHHSYRVIRGFADINGQHIAFDTVGVIRHIDISDDWTQIIIDWEQDGKTLKLVFAMNATDGPRNNHMRTYFEKGELSLPPRPAKPKPELAPAPAPAAEPSEDASPGERTVACGCPSAFHRAVWPAAHPSVHACLRCGEVSVTEQIGDDGRFTGNAWTAYRPVPTPDAVARWLGRFPRVSVDHAGAPWRWPMSATLVRYPTLVYPANVRVKDHDALAALEQRLREKQADMPRAHRLGRELMDVPAPPPGVPDTFGNFLFTQQTGALRENADPEKLRHHARLINPACELAADLLLRRPDAYGLMMGWLVSSDGETFDAGIAMLRDARRLFNGPDDPRLAPEILRIMDGLPLGKHKDVPGRIESCARFEALLVAIADLGANSPAMLDGLSALAHKIGGKDSYVVNAIRVVINELNGIDNKPSEYR